MHFGNIKILRLIFLKYNLLYNIMEVKNKFEIFN